MWLSPVIAPRTSCSQEAITGKQQHRRWTCFPAPPHITAKEGAGPVIKYLPQNIPIIYWQHKGSNCTKCWQAFYKFRSQNRGGFHYIHILDMYVCVLDWGSFLFRELSLKKPDLTDLKKMVIFSIKKKYFFLFHKNFANIFLSHWNENKFWNMTGFCRIQGTSYRQQLQWPRLLKSS